MGVKKTPEFLAGLYEKSGLSHRELGERCGLSKVAVWRAVTPGWAIRGHTLDVLLRDGFGLEPDSRQYKQAVALWTQERLTGPDTVAAKQDLIQKVAGMDAKKLKRLEEWLAKAAG